MRSTAYSDLLRIPGIRVQAFAGLLAQATQGMAGIGIILVVRGHGGSLALAGAVVGSLSVAAGISRPVQGRFIDRRGSAGVMALCGLIHPAAIIGVVVLANIRAGGLLLIALGAVAGLALPPVSTSMRATWATAVAAAERTSAYSLVYLTQELAILLGPLLFAVITAVDNASVAVTVLAAIAGIGAVGFATVATPTHAARNSRRRGVALRTPGMYLLVAIVGLIGGAIGSIEVAVPTLASAHGAPAASGVLIAALSVGGIAGAAIYGSRRWRAVPARRLGPLLLALTVPVILMIPVGSLLVLGALLFVAGVALNPGVTTVSLLVDQHTTADSVAESFGWLSTGLAAGTGAASALAGALTHTGHPGAAFAVAAISSVAATLLVAGSRRVLARPPVLSH